MFDQSARDSHPTRSHLEQTRNFFPSPNAGPMNDAFKRVGFIIIKRYQGEKPPQATNGE